MPTIVEEASETSNLEKGATPPSPSGPRTLWSKPTVPKRTSWESLSPVQDMKGEKIVALFVRYPLPSFPGRL